MVAIRTLALLAAPALAAYDEETALQYAYLCTASMCSPGASEADNTILEAWACGPACGNVSGMTNVRAIQPIAQNDAYAFVGKLNGKCVAVFRGTSDLNGWITDLKSMDLVSLEDQGVPCKYNQKSCQVGQGFMDNYNSLASMLKGNLSDIGCTKGSQLSITGHSLGAAEAGIAMFDLKNEGYDIVETYTFGQPRIGDETFVQAFVKEFSATEVYRVTHANDPVPHLPFEFQGFSHMPTEVYYESTVAKGHKVCDGSGEDQSCSNSRSSEVPATVLSCATDKTTCPHLDYMTDKKTILMDGSTCPASSLLV